jgi:repressor LexA
MIDALINEGDIVILEPTRSCDDGDMVAVWLRDENETTLKKFFHEGARVRLQPMNSTMQPIYTRPENVEVQGRVVAAIRNW